MKTYKFWQAPFYAFFSKDFYRSVGKHWKGLALTYLLFLLAITWIPTVLKINKQINKFENEFLADIIAKVPEMEINDGKLISSVKMPYIMDLKIYRAGLKLGQEIKKDGKYVFRLLSWRAREDSNPRPSDP